MKHRLYRFVNKGLNGSSRSRPYYLLLLFIFMPLTKAQATMQPPTASLSQLQQGINLNPDLTLPSPNKPWQTLTTAHFYIHSPAQYLNIAQRMAVIAEQVHEKLSPTLRWQPSDKTHVILNDTVDFSNAFATPIPRNKVSIYLTTPVFGELKDHSDWLEIVFTHEYTHTLHIDQVAGFPARIRAIFGRGGLPALVSFPQLFAPRWLSEGIAVYQESANGLGRGNNAIYESQMREEVRNGLRSFSELSYEGVNQSRWPNNLVYLYGTYFFQFIEATYGTEKVVNYITQPNRNLIPWRLDTRAKQTFGLGSRALWSDFQAYIKQRFLPQIKKINAQNTLAQPPLITAKKTTLSHLTAGPNNTLFYYHNDYANPSEIKKIAPNGDVNHVLTLDKVTGLDWHAKQGLLISRVTTCGSSSALTTDLFQYQPSTQRLTQLTHCQRHPRAHWTKEGNAIIAVSLAAGETNLVELTPATSAKNSAYTHISPLAHFSIEEAMGHFDISPTTHTLVASVKRADTGWNLETLSLTSKKWQRLTQDSRIPNRPKFSYYSGDERITYTADTASKQQVELFSYSIITPNTPLTQSLGYVVEHVPNVLGIWVSRYGATGDSLELLPWKTLAPTPNQTKQPLTRLNDKLKHTVVQQPYFETSVKQVLKNNPSAPYAPSETLMPVNWFPSYQLTNDANDFVGVQLQGQDILGFHNWALSPLFYIGQDEQNTDTHAHKIGGFASYTYHRHYSVLINQAELQYPTQVASINAHQSTQTWQAQATFPFSLPFSSDSDATTASKGSSHAYLDLTLLAASQRQTAHFLPNTTTTSAPATHHTQDTLLGISTSYNTLAFYARGLSATNGMAAKLHLETYDIGTSRYQGHAVIGQGAGYFSLGNRQTFSLSALMATGSQGINPFKLGGYTSPSLLNVAQTPFVSNAALLGTRNYGLKGYAAHTFVGNHLTKISADYRFPIATIYDGFSVFPLGVGKLHGKIFAASGDAWSASQSFSPHHSVGAELTTEVQIGFDTLLLPITLGLAQGLDSSLGTTQFYLTLNASLP